MATFDDLTNSFTRGIDEAVDEIRSARVLNPIGKEILERIIVRTRRGFGVSRNGGRQRRLRPLSPGYVEQRRDARRLGALSNQTTPARSNATFSGNMLNSTFSRARDRGIIFGFSNAEAAEAAADLHENGRPFFFLTGADISRTTRELTALVRRAILEEI